MGQQGLHSKLAAPFQSTSGLRFCTALLLATPCPGVAFWMAPTCSNWSLTQLQPFSVKGKHFTAGCTLHCFRAGNSWWHGNSSHRHCSWHIRADRHPVSCALSTVSWRLGGIPTAVQATVLSLPATAGFNLSYASRIRLSVTNSSGRAAVWVHLLIRLSMPGLANTRQVMHLHGRIP